MTDVLIKRELLELSLNGDEQQQAKARNKLREQLAAPRQPEGEGLEVVAWQDADNPLYTTAERRQMHGWATDGYPIVELCRLSDAQRAIAELRELIGAAQRVTCAVIDERDTLRQQLDERDATIERLEAGIPRIQEQSHQMRKQLAERDAEIERLRVKLMTIASVEPGRHNIEWAKAMAATGNNEAYAKWREAFDQRDRLAELLRQAMLKMAYMLKHGEWHNPEELIERIDAELSEVK